MQLGFHSSSLRTELPLQGLGVFSPALQQNITSTAAIPAPPHRFQYLPSFADNILGHHLMPPFTSLPPPSFTSISAPRHDTFALPSPPIPPLSQIPVSPPLSQQSSIFPLSQEPSSSRRCGRCGGEGHIITNRSCLFIRPPELNDRPNVTSHPII